MDERNEVCWVLLGSVGERYWQAVSELMTVGEPASVSFDSLWKWVVAQEERDKNVVGFMHTHPTFPATPSPRDYATMQAWADCFGHSLVCLIQGADGLKGWWFDPGEERWCEECLVENVGGLYVGEVGQPMTMEDLPDEEIDREMQLEDLALPDEEEINRQLEEEILGRDGQAKANQ